MKHVLLGLLLFFSVATFAQVGIGTTTPLASAMLDVRSTNKGFLPPRVTLTSTTDATTIASPAEGLLVYNLGSTGLQAGYYYWNGANWSTIATATSSGNGLTAMDMVKLYSKVYSTAAGDIANTNGYSFTVPVSGRYLFDFSCSGFATNASATMTFKVRQGTTDLGTDAQTSYNNTIHSEYNGKVEVNLQAGTTYNVYVSSTGVRDVGDYDRVYYKIVSGNLPVNGQSVDYVSVSSTTVQTVNTTDKIKFNSIVGGNIPYDAATGNFTLTAGKTYRLTGSVSLDGTNGVSAEIDVAWRNAAGDILGNRALILSTTFVSNAAGNGVTDIIYTPTVNTTISLYVTYATANAKTVPNYTFANIQQIGSSAIVNPWTLSGTNTYNTTGNVGIGNNVPTQALDVTGTGKFSNSIINSGNRTYFGKDGANMQWFATTDPVSEPNNLAYGFESNGSSIQSHKWYVGGAEKMRLDASGNLNVTGKINLTDATGNVAQKVSALVNAGTYVQLDNIKATVTTSGNRGLSVAAVGTPFYCNIGATFGGISAGGGGGSGSNVYVTTTPSTSLFNWSFASTGEISVYNVTDVTSNRVYRITLQIGASYLSNFICIERLL